MDRSTATSAVSPWFSEKHCRGRAGRAAILIELAMAHPGIPRTPQKDAARQRSKAAAARAFSTVSQLTDIHRLAHALCGRSVSSPCSSLQPLSLALDFTTSSRATIRKSNRLYSWRGQATPSLAGFRREAFSEAASRREGWRDGCVAKLAPAMSRGLE